MTDRFNCHKDDEDIRYLIDNFSEAYSFVLQQLKGIQDDRAIAEFEDDYGEQFCRDLLKLINRRKPLPLVVEK